MTEIGLVGCGRWGRLILRDLLSLGAAVTVAATGEHAQHAALSGARAVVGRIEDLPAVDGLVIATPTSTHADVIEALLPRGVPIFCEKPLCNDAARARQLAERGRDRVFVMEKWRYHRGVEALAFIARSQELGPVIGLRTERLGYGHAYTDTDCIWTLLPHEFSIASEILGELPRPRSACADVADRDVFGLIAMSAIDAGPWHVTEISARSPLRRRAITLLCRDGAAMLEDAYADHVLIVAKPRLVGQDEAVRTTKRPIQVEMPLLEELAVFLAYLRGGPPPKAPVEQAADAVEAVAAIRRLAGL